MIEDNPGDVRLMVELLRESPVTVQLHVAIDGIDAMEFLGREGRYVHAPRPSLILLDLNLPRMDGREVLARIKKSEDLRSIPTIVLTSSEADSDVRISYHLHANCYLKKPVQLEESEDLVRSINDFWLSKVIYLSKGVSDVT